jgi:hypothetical protein
MSARLVGIAVRGSRWGLPWICGFAIAGSLGFALNAAVSGGAAGRAVHPSITARQTPAGPDPFLMPERCTASNADPMYLRVEVDSSIVAASRRQVIVLCATRAVNIL